METHLNSVDLDIKDIQAPIGHRREVWGLVSLAATLISTLALASYSPEKEYGNWAGPLGYQLATILITAFGVVGWILPFELGLSTVRFFTGRGVTLGLVRLVSTFALLILGCTLIHLTLAPEGLGWAELPGGSLGEILGEVARSLLGTFGASVFFLTLMLITLVLRMELSVVTLAAQTTHALGAMSTRLRNGFVHVRQAWQKAKDLEALERSQRLEELEPHILEPRGLSPVDLADSPSEDDRVDEDVNEAHAASIETIHIQDPDPLAPVQALHLEEPSQKILAKTPKAAARKSSKLVRPDFVLPSSALLDAHKVKAVRVDEKVLRATAQRLVEKLAAYGVAGRVDEIRPGPVVTMYEFEPESGTKVSKIASLADDLAMALAAQKVRIVAPIPGKARVGFELPNDQRQTVFLREIVEENAWENSDASLPVAFGQDIGGQPVYGDLAKMPHLLVAGATGAGKSVGINVMLTSLLLKKTPEEVRFLMIDPKVVELAVFDGIPHMLLPVVTDMKKAALALRWAVDEMERRYQLFADAGARNIVTYNERVVRVQRGEMPKAALTPKRAHKVRAQGPNGEELLLEPTDGERADALDGKMPEKLPYVVVVVDEFADLMMVAAKDVESAIARLAQKARAAGIHVILATQRPSVDVITGMIKANFPARVAFKVSQREDSKTILGRSGAEHLLGAGDMLIIPPGSSDLKRVHCAYVSEDEVKSICDYLRAQGSPVYDEQILKPREEENEETNGAASGAATSDDPMYDRAVAIVADAGYCSISQIQRHLSLGYNRAAKLVERMEKESVVGPPSPRSGGRREVLIRSL